jgi:hypothetical protein
MFHRMYQRAAEVWHGFAKNAHGDCLLRSSSHPRAASGGCSFLHPVRVLAIALISSNGRRFSPRLARFRQSLFGALLHPLGICALVAIQWFAFIRSLRQRPAVWKGRSYSPVHAP